MTIRPATSTDADAIAAIYGHHVLNGVATFDTIPPDPSSARERIEECQKAAWPFLVADDGGDMLGYAYATQIRPRPAYARTAENSIYVRHDRLGQGIGRLLLADLMAAATSAGFRQMIAVVGGADPASAALHQALGFRHAAATRPSKLCEPVLNNVPPWPTTSSPIGNGAASPLDTRRLALQSAYRGV